MQKPGKQLPASAGLARITVVCSHEQKSRVDGVAFGKGSISSIAQWSNLIASSSSGGSGASFRTLYCKNALNVRKVWESAWEAWSIDTEDKVFSSGKVQEVRWADKNHIQIELSPQQTQLSLLISYLNMLTIMMIKYDRIITFLSAFPSPKWALFPLFSQWKL